MARFSSPLNNIKIAKPCSESWDEMYGTDRKRLCAKCDLNVFNLSAMTKAEAENLIFTSEGRVCARFYRREDGTIITKDCPVGLKAARKKIRKIWTATASMVMALFAGIGIVSLFESEEIPAEVGVVAIERPLNDPMQGSVEVMGDIAIEEPHVMGEIEFDRK